MQECLDTTDAVTPVLGGDAPWYALHVRSNFEKKCAELLRFKGLCEFLPSYRSRNRWSDRVKVVERPLFPGYVFCRIETANWLPVLQTPGVVQPVGFGGKAAVVDEKEIAALQSLVKSPVPLFPRAFLTIGKRVLIKRGPLAGLEGILEEIGKNYRIVVSVTLLQRSVSAEIEADWVTERQ
jgi:transcription antitermination factor NusG